MPRKEKIKKVRTLDQLYQGDEQHDDAPKTSWEAQIERENKRFEAKVKRQKLNLQNSSKKKDRIQKLKAETSSRLSELKIRPDESLRDFKDRVNIEARLLQSEQAKLERNKRRKEKISAKDAMRKDEEEHDEWNTHDGSKTRFGRSLPGFVRTVEQPPELDYIHNNKKRFAQLAPTASALKQDQMAALLQRAQGMYKGKKL